MLPFGLIGIYSFLHEKMNKLGLLPYPMVYNNSDVELKKFQRWVIRRYYKFVPWDEYSRSGDSHSRRNEN